MTDLKGKSVLTEEEIKSRLTKLKDGWEVDRPPDEDTAKLIKEFEFNDFKGAMSFVNKVAQVAEVLDHHPNIYLHDYKKVKLELYTHQINGLHENDFLLASKIDNIIVNK